MPPKLAFSTVKKKTTLESSKKLLLANNGLLRSTPTLKSAPSLINPSHQSSRFSHASPDSSGKYLPLTTATETAIPASKGSPFPEPPLSALITAAEYTRARSVDCLPTSAPRAHPFPHPHAVSSSTVPQTVFEYTPMNNVKLRTHAEPPPPAPDTRICQWYCCDCGKAYGTLRSEALGECKPHEVNGYFDNHPVVVEPASRFTCLRCRHMMCPYCLKLRYLDLSPRT